MTLESVVALTALTRGVLVNDPVVRKFDGIAFEPHRVKRGNLFIALNSEHIEEAVQNGAYGIIVDKPVQIIDPEIAWIKVDSVDDALLRLLRFHLIDKSLTVIACNPISLKLAAQLALPSNVMVITEPVRHVFKKLWYCEPKTMILFSPSLTDEKLFTDVKPLPMTDKASITVIEKTLFETSFIYNDRFYERQSLSPFFVPFLEQLLDFLSAQAISFRLRSFSPIHHFDPIFLNKSFNVQEFGTSERVLILEPETSLITSQIAFLAEETIWATTIYLLPEGTQVEIALPELYFYRSIMDIPHILRSIPFHFALIGGVDRSLLSLLPVRSAEQMTLPF